MADIFISYAREDETRIRELVRGLEKQGWSIFWDRRIPAGKTWQSYIGQALSDAQLVIVAWSQHSITSDWVIEEANDAKERGHLVPVLLDSVRPPLGFRGIQAADLTNWKLGDSSPQFDQLIQDIAGVLGDKPHQPTPEELVTPRTQPVATPRAIPTEPSPHEPAPPKPEPLKDRLREPEAIKPESAEVGKKRNYFLTGTIIAIALAIVAGWALWSSRDQARLAETRPAPIQSEPMGSQPSPVPRSPSSLRDALRAYKYNFGWSGGPQIGTETLSPVTMVTFGPDGRVVLHYARPGTIVASLEERMLSGTWKDSDGEGELELRFTMDFSHAEGWWRYKGQEQKYPALMKRFE